MRETTYWTKRKLVNIGRSVLYKFIPNWLVRESMMYASRYFKSDEIVPEVRFIDVFERVCNKKVQHD